MNRLHPVLALHARNVAARLPRIRCFFKDAEGNLWTPRPRGFAVCKASQAAELLACLDRVGICYAVFEDFLTAPYSSLPLVA
jgi:hypothetical protein